MDDDKAMEDLFREILASPKPATAPLLSVADSCSTEMMSIGSVGGSEVSEEMEAKGEEKGERFWFQRLHTTQQSIGRMRLRCRAFSIL